jgi:hypothetical protein
LPHVAKGVAHVSAASIQSSASSSVIAKLPVATSHDVLQAFVLSFHDMFLIAVPVVLLAFVAALFLRETPLRDTAKGPEVV